MSHRTYDPSTRPLIDQIPDNDILSVSDEDESFYARDDDAHILHPYWRSIYTKTASRVPRRVQRYFFVYLAIFVLFLIGWKAYLGPRYSEYRQLIKAMDTEPKDKFGENVRPEFKDMVMVNELDGQYLPSETNGRRLVFVGDVHGCREELERLLHKLSFDKHNDHLILLGDIVSKGPDSAGVVSLASLLSASCVRGNHEDKLLLSIAKREKRLITPTALEIADTTPYEDLEDEAQAQGNHKLRKLAKSMSKANIKWLKTCPVILHIGQVPHIGDMVAVHAGLVPGVSLDRQDPFQCMNMRTIDLDTRIPSETREHTPWTKFWNHQQEKLHASKRTTVVYGHDRKTGLNIKKWSKGLDSGCVAGGKLTAWVVDGKGEGELVHVKCKGHEE
ncbi:Metallo-dependent phosphatase [Polyplosphaeria fusca]|uniref:Metallo-dependent phosphatase n=1 Tax=Polyplosphaeria fusca TaxID=682080 RepID=A0A9P4V1A1_9PLEO|nr:Metallo-dependent phosphatase [Polyplosphaeria fusca]